MKQYSLVQNRHIKAILAQLEAIEMKLSDAVKMMVEIKANLQEASQEILARLDAYAGAIDTDPEAAMMMLEEIRVSAKKLADIVPNED